jgi:uncharacterized protein (TIGR04255 family)
MGEQYNNPPLVEAFCQFNFEQDTDWDGTIPGMIYSKVKNEGFPIKRQVEPISIEFEISKTPIQTQKIRPNVERMRFLSINETSLIQTGPYFLAINVVKPYPSWEVFKSLIIKGLNIYREVAEPNTLSSVALRYINHINLKKNSVELEDYFDFRPQIGSKLPKDYGPISLTVQFPYNEDTDILQMQLVHILLDPNSLSYSLDLTYTHIKPGELDFAQIPDWLEEAHNSLESAFEGSITDNTRKLFDKES